MLVASRNGFLARRSSGVSCEDVLACIDGLVVETGDVVAPSSSATTGQAADAAAVWSMIGDVETLLHTVNYGSETPGHSGGDNL